MKDKLVDENLNCINANLFDSSTVIKNKSKNFKRQNGKNSQKKGQFNATGRKIKKKKLICYVCEKEEHKSYQCNQRKGKPNQRPILQVNLVEQDDDVIVVVVEVNLIKNKTNWILDTRALIHFYTN